MNKYHIVTFGEDSRIKLEKEMNSWLDTHPDIEIISVSYSTEPYYYGALLTYKIK